MDKWYWIGEYAKVLCGYLFLMFLWPSVVFHGHLKGRPKTYRFAFCVTAPIVIMNTVVLGLGLVHGLNRWLICLLFYGVFVLALLRNMVSYLNRQYKKMVETKFPDFLPLKGRYRALVLILVFFIVCYKYVRKALRFLSIDYIRKIKSCSRTKVRLKMKEGMWNFAGRLSFLFWEYGVLALVVVFGMAYFSYGAFQLCSYGYGDLYSHHQWIYGLIEGNAFSGGVYPQAMHCFIYCMHMLSGIRVHSILLYLQSIHVAVFLLAAYFLLRRIFCWRYTPLFVLMLFLTWDLCNADLIHSMFRLQITLPQEFGLHTVCLSALYLMNYLESGHADTNQKYIWNENLLLFVISLTAAFMTHFHVVLMAAIVCVSFAVFAFRRIFHRKYLVPLTACFFGACMIAAAPMAGALAQGVPFNESINWAVNAMSGDESRDLRRQAGEEDAAVRTDVSITATALHSVVEIYDKGYAALYGKGRGGWMMLLTAAAAGLCLLFRRGGRWERFRDVCAAYPPVILCSVLYVFVYAAPMFGLPDIIPEGRFFAPGHMLLLAVMVMPADLLFSVLMRLRTDLIPKALSLLSIAGIYGITVVTGSFRGFLFYELSRYNAAAAVTDSIIDTFPQYSYTIVSPTDELYSVVQYGWHEELLSFVEKSGGGSYSIPSEYVFIYVEKEPLLYAQSHFFSGPSWMGTEKYLEPFWEVYSVKYPDSGASQSPGIIAAQVSEEQAQEELPACENAWEMYLKLENRTVLESKAYAWCQKFSREHPSVLNVYYEDDEFVCYYFRQDMGNPPYELGTG